MQNRFERFLGGGEPCFTASLEYPYAPWSVALQRGALAIPRYKQLQLLKLKGDLLPVQEQYNCVYVTVCACQKTETITQQREGKDRQGGEDTKKKRTSKKSQMADRKALNS